MDGARFDDLARVLTAERSRRAIVPLLGAFALGALAGAAQPAAAKRDRKRKRRRTTICHGGRTLRVGKRGLKLHRGHGDPLGPCPSDPCAACGPDQFCTDGACQDCKSVDASCADDVECCSGICDGYFDTCQTVRFGCDPAIPGQCPNRGICCQTPSSVGEFVCIDDPSSNDNACGAGCDSLVNCRNATVCRNGQCCCPDNVCAIGTTPCPP